MFGNAVAPVGVHLCWLMPICRPRGAFRGTGAANQAPEINTDPIVIPEDLPVGAEAFRVKAFDADGDKLTYGISGPYAYLFEIIKDTGEVKLKNLLDYETAPWFQITVSVSDGFNSPVTRDLLVKVEDRNDNKPVFLNTDFSVKINEVIPTTEDSKSLFVIWPNGSIALNGSLEYNSKSSFYQLKLEACDSGGLFNNSFVNQCSEPVFLSISVIDQPNLDPKFVKEFYSASVSEDASVGTSVLQVQATDSDRGVNDRISYNISNSTRPDWFYIEPDGVIKVNSSLDREQLLDEDEEVHVQVTATEEQLNIHGQEAKVSIWVTLRVTDVNDNDPEFYNCSFPACTFTPEEAQNNFTGYVDEHASIRIPIDDLTMVAYDPDKAGAPGQDCGLHFWRQEPVAGDWGKCPGGRITRAGVPTTQHAQRLQGSNGTFLLFLRGPDAEAFSVSPEKAVGTAEVQVLVRTPSMVDYENHTMMVVEVVANDLVSQNVSVASVTIYLRDINDHRPAFPQEEYKRCVHEHSPNGTVVSDDIRVSAGTWLGLAGRDMKKATDQDTGEWGNITYSLLPGSGTDIFAVDSISGNLTVTNCELLDREKQPVYYLTLQATDGGGLSTSTLLEIVLLDINDNGPVVSGFYNIFVREVLDNVSTTIQAYDADQPGTNNSLLQFTLSGPYSHNFSVSLNDGNLTNVGSLDREAIDPAEEGRIKLIVNVSDSGEPQFSTVASVTITVEDINDNLPIFNQSEYSFSVKERTSGVVGTVQASDADQTEANNRISFSLSGTGANNFIIQGQVLGSGQAQGKLQLPSDVSLDYETQTSYNLTVTAENPDPEAENSTAKVVVIVQDVNDEPPTLDSASLGGISVAENGSRHGLVTEVVARDVDTEAQLEIQLMNVICTKAGSDVGSLCHGWFSVMGNGSVFINQSNAIDYETCDLVTLIVRAHDLTTAHGFQAYSDNGSLPITIEDVNDNAPYFLPEDKTFVIIPELVLPNQEVATVRARDDDSGDNGNIHFSIHQMVFIANGGTTTPFQGFWISTSVDANVFVGSIKLVTNLNATRQGTYEVTVRAQDQPPVAPTQQANITLKLFTVDESYRVRLQFSMSKEEVGLKSDEIKTTLAQVTRTTVYIVNIQDIETAARARGRSYLDAYFVFPNGTALTLDELILLIRSDQDSMNQLLQLGLVVVGSEERQESNLLQVLSSVIIGLGIALLLVIVIMAVSLMCVRKRYCSHTPVSPNYERKLRATKAAKEARNTVMGIIPSVSAIPGTNMYTAEKANPMLNLHTKDLGFESQSSSSDLDHVR
ncbi:Cadherin-related family member 2 [Galemys pyrenaicus]|uniref:Cadherin-related family member 2 n=1 Tax=Galemys pyrenaicus TaxID=202257 RepID=A0A8J6A5F2_GALPY|nr:Cadherin-related family member 2 [Galemys pyrenaicus]